jgi:O-antigen/teichoic acid export membrane protein
MPFLAATLALTAMRTIDRYALEHFRGDEAVGVLTFFMFIRGAIQSLIDSGVVFILQPRIVAARQTGRLDEYRHLMRDLALGVLGVALGLSALAALLIRPAVLLIGRPEYGREMSAFWTVLALTVVAALTDVPHTALYARNLDRAIITAALLGLGAALFANLALVPAFGISGAAAATMCGFAAMGLYSAWVLREAGPPAHAT